MSSKPNLELKPGTFRFQFILLGLFVALFVSLNIYFFSSSGIFSPKVAEAATPVLNLSPGQVARIVIYYDNSSTGTDFSGLGRLKIVIDERLDYVEGFLKDTYDSDIRCVNDSTSSGIIGKTSIQGQTNATIIDYTPKSSTTAASGNNCSTGSGSKGNTVTTNIPKANSNFNPNNATTWRGRLEFRVRLRSDTFTSTNLKIGDIIDPDNNGSNVGIQGEFSLNNVVIGAPRYAIKISGVTITQDVIVSASCIGQPVLVGENAQCGFRLSGGNNTTNLYLLPDDFKVQIQGSGSFADKNSCQLDNLNSLLTCSIPTTNAINGRAVPVSVTLSGNTSVRTNIDLITDFDPKADFDKDGISNEVECGFSSGRNCKDAESDGILDYKDVDSDNDGIPDLIEAQCSREIGTGFPCDTDGEGVADYLDVDSDNDERLDLDEKGALKCDTTIIPAKCENEIRDSDNDGIPNFRDKDDGIFDVRYLIGDSSVKFSYQNQSKPIWGQSDLVVDISIGKDIVDCEVNFRRYSSQDWWIGGEVAIATNSCKAILKADKQYTQKWDTLIILTDKNGDRWGAYPSFSMENGSVGGTTIEAKVQEGVTT